MSLWVPSLFSLKKMGEIYSTGSCTYHTWCWSNSCCSDSWGRDKSGKNIAVSCGCRNRCLIIHRRKSEWHYEFKKLEDQNTKVYKSLLKKIALIVGYIFASSLKRSSRFGSSKQKVWESSEFPIYTRGLETN